MYQTVTNDIAISVEPFYIEDQSEPEKERWVFGYRVTIENRGTVPVQLMTRHWQITDARGRQIEVKGEGVIGEQPHLSPGERFQYTSGTPLSTPTGFMMGSYGMAAEDGLRFEVAIPPFSLDVPDARRPLH